MHGPCCAVALPERRAELVVRKMAASAQSMRWTSLAQKAEGDKIRPQCADCAPMIFADPVVVAEGRGILCGTPCRNLDVKKLRS